MNVDVMRVAQHADRKGYEDFISSLEVPPLKNKVESGLVGNSVESKVPGLRYD